MQPSHLPWSKPQNNRGPPLLDNTHRVPGSQRFCPEFWSAGCRLFRDWSRTRWQRVISTFFLKVILLTSTRFVEFETAADLKTAVEKLDSQTFKGATVHCTADVCSLRALL